MLTVSIAINGVVIFARSARRTDDPDRRGVATYLADDGRAVRHKPKDGAIALAKRLLDGIKE